MEIIVWIINRVLFVVIIVRRVKYLTPVMEPRMMGYYQKRSVIKSVWTLMVVPV